jgi:hypothetical protein
MIFLVNPLHYALHHDVRWSLAERFPFAAGQLSVPVARSELRGLADRAPILVQQSGTQFVPVILLEADWCRAPLFDADMKWLGPHPPLSLRYHPFRTLDDAARPGTSILGVASDPDCVSRDHPNAFFDELARPMPIVKAVLRRLQRIQFERAQLVSAASALQQAGLLTQLSLADSRDRRLFYSLDSAKFRELDGPGLAELGTRPQDAFMLAAVLEHSRYRHLSEAPAYASLANQQKAPSRPARPLAKGPTSFLVDDDFTMTFDP